MNDVNSLSHTDETPARSKKRSEIHESETHLSRRELRDRRVLRTLIHRNFRRLSWYTALNFLNEAMQMSVPVFLGYIIDLGVMKGDVWFTVWATLAVIVLRLASAWAWAASFYGTMQIRTQEQHNLRLAVTAAALDPVSRPLDRPSGEVLSIATSDADRAPDIFDMIGWALSASIAIVGAGIWLLWINAWLGLAVFAGLGLQVVALKFITPVLSQKYDAQQSKAADAASTATDLVHGLRVLQGLGVQSRARLVYRERSRTALDAALVNARYSGLSNGLMTFISGVTIAAVLLIAGSLTLADVITVGTLISVAGLVRNMAGMMDGLSGVPVWFASFSTSARRVRHLLSEMGRSLHDSGIESAVSANGVKPIRPLSSRQPDPTPAPGAAGSVPSPSATGRRLPGVGSIHLSVIGDVRDGEVIAVVPESAADAAAVLGDFGVLPLARESILLEPHTVDLFDGTLREQLATGRPSALDGSEDAWAHTALQAAGAEDLLEILPDQLDERIIDRGANLSGGQRQRLALARAVAADPPVLVLHDPTTAVDAVTEQKIAQALTQTRAAADRITVILTKAPALANEAHRVVFVRRGEVAASGSHHSLMSNSSYAEVVQR